MGCAECLRAIRPGAPGNADHGRHIIGAYVRHSNTERIHSAINYALGLAGPHLAIVTERDRKLEATRERRAECRREAGNAGLPRASSPELLDNHP